MRIEKRLLLRSRSISIVVKERRRDACKLQFVEIVKLTVILA